MKDNTVTVHGVNSKTTHVTVRHFRSRRPGSFNQFKN